MLAPLPITAVFRFTRLPPRFREFEHGKLATIDDFPPTAIDIGALT